MRIATLEFLTGLLATACPPRDGNAWLDGWEVPPEPSALDDAFAPLVAAFNLDGDGPRFAQDFTELEADSEPIERLLIESPGNSTVKKNTDLMVHRGRVANLSRPAAAIALYTLQSWAPSGGAGNRVGLRGGGPLVTLVIPPGNPSLWHTIWTNVPNGETPATADLPRVFPWLAPTRLSTNDEPTTPEHDAHPLQCWWGMPRRIRLNFSTPQRPRACDLTGVVDSVAVQSWRQRPKGVKYVAWGRVHPMTPHYQQKPGAEWLPLHPRPGGIGYQHWLGIVVAKPNGLGLPAAAVVTGRSRMLEVIHDTSDGASARLLTAGYDTDNAKARGFIESEMPIFAVPNAQVDALAIQLVQSADIAARLARSAVRHALFRPDATVALDGALLSSVRERLWSDTSAAFFTTLQRAATDETAAWLALLRSTVLALFDEAAPLTATSGSAAQRICQARRNLRFSLFGYGKEGMALFNALELAPPEPKAKKGKQAA